MPPASTARLRPVYRFRDIGNVENRHDDAASQQPFENNGEGAREPRERHQHSVKAAETEKSRSIVRAFSSDRVTAAKNP